MVLCHTLEIAQLNLISKAKLEIKVFLSMGRATRTSGYQKVINNTGGNHA